jgi:hypothetical protein
MPCKESSRRIRIEIRRVFMEVWDPIGVRDEPNAWDEYDGYLGHALELLIAGASDHEWEEYLDWITARMGMDSSRHSHSEVIQALRTIDLREVEGTF